MAGLYGITSNTTVVVSNTPGLYITSGNATFAGNVTNANTPGLYIGSGNVQVLNNAQILLNLLSNASTVGFSLTNANTQVQGTVLPSGVGAGTYGDTTDIPRITVGADGRITSITNVPVVIPSSYGNANVAAYLASGTDPTINSLFANAATQAGQINAINSNVTAANIQIATIQSNIGSFYSYANITFATVANLSAYETYANAQISSTNANVAAANVAIANLQSNAAIQETEISGLRANITAANAAIVSVQANLTAFENYANVTFVTTANATTYSNANVAAYLPTNSNILAIWSNINATNANIGAFETYANIYFGNLSANAASQEAEIATINSNVAAANIAIQTLSANVGAFETYANAAFQTSGFSGNLAGNVLYDGINKRWFANVYPLSTPSAITTLGTAGNGTIGGTNPTYIAGVLQPPPNTVSTLVSGQTIGAVLTGNIVLATASGAGAVRQNVGHELYLQAQPNSSTMNNSDRIRGGIIATDVVLAGQTWGTMATPGSQTQTTIAGGQSYGVIDGYGQSATVIGHHGIAIAHPIGGSANVQYATGIHAQAGWSVDSTVQQLASNIAYARGFNVSIQTSSQANLTIQNAIGLHVSNTWRGSATGTISNAYSILVDDIASPINTSSNVVFNTAYTSGSPRGIVFADGTFQNTAASGGGSGGFSGNLSGNTLIDSVNGHIWANAYPQSPTYLDSTTLAIAAPVYSGGLITTGGITTLELQANALYATKGGTTQNLINTQVINQVWLANATMNNNDRIAAVKVFNEVRPQGATYGSYQTNQGSYLPDYFGPPGSGIDSQAGVFINYQSGTGNISVQKGVGITNYANPESGSININQQFALDLRMGYNAGVNPTQSRIDLAAGINFGAQRGNVFANVNTINNVVGLWFANGWANGSSVTSANGGGYYGASSPLWNNDPSSSISTAGDIIVSGNLVVNGPSVQGVQVWQPTINGSYFPINPLAPGWNNGSNHPTFGYIQVNLDGPMQIDFPVGYGGHLLNTEYSGVQEYHFQFSQEGATPGYPVTFTVGNVAQGGTGTLPGGGTYTVGVGLVGSLDYTQYSTTECYVGLSSSPTGSNQFVTGYYISEAADSFSANSIQNDFGYRLELGSTNMKTGSIFQLSSYTVAVANTLPGNVGEIIAVTGSATPSVYPDGSLAQWNSTSGYWSWVSAPTIQIS